MDSNYFIYNFDNHSLNCSHFQNHVVHYHENDFSYVQLRHWGTHFTDIMFLHKETLMKTITNVHFVLIKGSLGNEPRLLILDW